MKTVLAVVVVLVSSGAQAKSLQLAAFEGKGATRVREALASKLCRHLLCVEEEQEASNVLHGKVIKQGARTLLEVELRDSDGGVLLSQRVPLTGKTYAAKIDRAVRSALSSGAAATAQSDDSDELEVPEPAPAAAVPAKVEPAPAPAPKPEAAPSPVKNEVVARAREEEPRVDYSHRIVWLGAAVTVQSRQLAYQGLATPELNVSRETAIMPRASLALFPFAREGMSGFGVTGSFAMTVTSSPSELVARQLDAALAYGLRLGGTPLWVRPELGFRWHVLDGKGAATEYRALRAGVTLEAVLGPLQLYGSAAYLGVIGGGGELTKRYFTRARTGAAFTTELGFALNVMGKLDLTLSGTYDVYLHALQGEPGDLYVARSATDGYLGASLGLRLGF